MSDYCCDRCMGRTYARIDVKRFDDETGRDHFVKSDYVRCVNCKGESYFPKHKDAGK